MALIAPTLASYRASSLFALATAVVATLTLVGGWLLGSQVLIRLNPSFPGMVPSTALALILLSAPFIVDRPDTPLFKRAAALAAGTVAGADLIVIFSGVANGIDAVLFPDLARLRTNSMAPATAIGILFGAVALYSTTMRSTAADNVLTASGTMGLLVSGTALIGYAFDAEALYNVAWYSAMAVHTAFALALVLLAILLSRPDVGWLSVLLGHGAGSQGARRLLPVVVILPIVLCFVALMASEAGYLNANFRLSVVALVMIVLLATSVIGNAKLQNAVEDRLHATMGDLRVTVQERDLLLREVYHRVKNNLQQINAMIALEMGNADEPATKAVLAATAARVNALGYVHTLLVSSERPSHLDVEAFLTSLVTNLVAGHGGEGRKITAKVDVDHDVIGIDPAISIGLLVNELVTNAVKHGFAGDTGGEVTVQLKHRDDGTRELIVRDNGSGVAEIACDAPVGTGQRIIMALVAQLKATQTVEHEGGTVVTIQIPASSLEVEAYA